jgi:uncharacterized protein (DUF433 family)
MATELIHSGPEIIGTRINVYHLLPYFLDPTATEAQIAALYELTVEQVAAARAYVLNNPDTVLARHQEIEARLAAGNPPEILEQAKQTHESFLKFKQWLNDRQASETEGQSAADAPGPPPTLREWLSLQQAHSAERA